MYRRIVVPLDGSDLAERALLDAEAMAKLASAPIHLVRVVEFLGQATDQVFGTMLDSGDVSVLVADDVDTARQHLDVMSHRMATQGFTVTYEVRRGTVAQQIVDATVPGDLCVMASHGRTGISRWFMGSVAEEVIRRSEVPVLLVRAVRQPGSPHRSAAGMEAVV